MNNTADIVRIIRVTDTREWVEGPDDKWRAVPGTGDERECERCGRAHEVHATVELSDGTVAVIGTGCAKGSTMERKLRSSASAAKTTARLRGQLAAAQAALATAQAVHVGVDALELPPITEDETTLAVGRDKGQPVPLLRMEDVTVWLQSWRDRREAEECLAEHWRAARRADRGIRRPLHSYRAAVADLEKRLEKRGER